MILRPYQRAAIDNSLMLSLFQCIKNAISEGETVRPVLTGSKSGFSVLRRRSDFPDGINGKDHFDQLAKNLVSCGMLKIETFIDERRKTKKRFSVNEKPKHEPCEASDDAEKIYGDACDFAAVFAERLIPHMIKVMSTDQLMEAIRQAYFEMENSK